MVTKRPRVATHGPLACACWCQVYSSALVADGLRFHQEGVVRYMDWAQASPAQMEIEDSAVVEEEATAIMEDGKVD